VKITRSLDIRYRYQVHELNVPLASGTWRISADEMDQVYTRFDELYEQTYGPAPDIVTREKNHGVSSDRRCRDRKT
jgi:hypothetical protein